MALTKLKLTPLCAGYAVMPGQEAISVKLDGGASRFRKDFSGAAFEVNASWIANARRFKYLWSFYRGITDSGALPFLIDLKLDGPEYSEYTANFLSFQVDSFDGIHYSISAVLEVIPNAVTDAMVDYVHMWNEFGEGFEDSPYLADLDQIVNIDLPIDLPG